MKPPEFISTVLIVQFLVVSGQVTVPNKSTYFVKFWNTTVLLAYVSLIKVELTYVDTGALFLQFWSQIKSTVLV